MKKLLIFLLLCMLNTPCFADTVETYKEYAIGDSATAENLNGNLDNIRNVVNGGLDNNNANTNSGFRFIEIVSALPAAGNQGRVVFLTSTNTLYFDDGSAMNAIAVLSNNQTFSGNNTFSGISTFSGATVLNVTTLSDKLTAGTDEIEGSAFDIDGGDVSAITVSGGLTWSAAQDLNSQNLTNVDIDSGTLDGVQVGGTTATGELLVNNASDAADGLGSQGTAGQFLQSAGAGANPTWLGALRIEIFTADEAAWEAPAGVTTVYTTMCGGGGGSGGTTTGGYAGGGSGAHCIVNTPYTVIPGNTYAIDIGDGGTAGGSGDTDGGDGQNSTFDATLTAYGGKGGSKGTVGTGGAAGGTCTENGTGCQGGILGLKGGDGNGNGSGQGGEGGGTLFGKGVDSETGGVEDGVAGTANTGVGAAGAGNDSAPNPGAIGGSGKCILMY